MTNTSPSSTNPGSGTSNQTPSQPHEFYPYRVQEKAGTAQVHTLESHEDIHKLHENARNRTPSKLILILIPATLIVGFILFYNQQARLRSQAQLALTPKPSPSITPSVTPTPTPTQKMSQFADPVLQEAYINTLAVQSMRVGFISDVTTKVLDQQTSQTQELTARAEGYFYGQTDGNTIQTELRIIQTNRANAQPAFFGQILAENRLFIKRNSDNWVERNRSDFNKLYENQPIDATAYAYNMVDTLFTQSKALLRAIDQNTIKADPDEEIDGKQIKVYSFQFSNIDYLNALKFDANTKEFTLEDARKILVNATITGKVYVDPVEKRIIRLQTNGTNFTQIAREEAEQQNLGIMTTHDITMIANLLDFNQPVSLQPPS